MLLVRVGCYVVCLFLGALDEVFLGHPVTVMFVAWCSSSPFCAVKAVGIVSVLGRVVCMVLVVVCLWPWVRCVIFLRFVIVRVSLQRLLVVASAEFGPSGRFSSKLFTGWSGTVLECAA